MCHGLQLWATDACCSVQGQEGGPVAYELEACSRHRGLLAAGKGQVGLLQQLRGGSGALLQ